MAGSKTYVTTNEALAVVVAGVDKLIGWAEADAAHAVENEAPCTASDDKQRVKLLRQARELLVRCER